MSGRDYGPIPLSVYDDPAYATLSMRAKFVLLGLLSRCCYRGRYSGEPRIVGRAIGESADIAATALDELEEARWIRRYVGENARGQSVSVAEIVDYHNLPGLPKDRRNKLPPTREWPDPPLSPDPGESPGSERGEPGERAGRARGASGESPGSERGTDPHPLPGSSSPSPQPIPPSSVQFSSEKKTAGARARSFGELTLAAMRWCERMAERRRRYGGAISATETAETVADDYLDDLFPLMDRPGFSACVDAQPGAKLGKGRGRGPIAYLTSMVAGWTPDGPPKRVNGDGSERLADPHFVQPMTRAEAAALHGVTQ